MGGFLYVQSTYHEEDVGEDQGGGSFFDKVWPPHHLPHHFLHIIFKSHCISVNYIVSNYRLTIHHLIHPWLAVRNCSLNIGLVADHVRTEGPHVCSQFSCSEHILNSLWATPFGMFSTMWVAWQEVDTRNEWVTWLTINFGVQFITLVINKCVKKLGWYLQVMDWT